MAQGHAIQRSVRQSPRKMRLVIDLIRHQDVNEALRDPEVQQEARRPADRQDAQERGGQRRAEGARGQRALRRGRSGGRKAIVNGGSRSSGSCGGQGRGTAILKRTSHVEIHVARKEKS